MRLVLQRVRAGCVQVDDTTVGAIGRGLVLLTAIGQQDDEQELALWAGKVIHLRIFPDETGKMNRSVLEIQGELLVVSQFTLYGDCRKGRRPSFSQAAPPAKAQALYERFVALLRESGLKVETGVFQATMQVEIQNDGPVTLLLGSD